MLASSLTPSLSDVPWTALPIPVTRVFSSDNNSSAAAQGRRVIKYACINVPRPWRSAATTTTFAEEGDSSDQDPTPYLFKNQAIKINQTWSSSRGHREQNNDYNTLPTTPTTQASPQPVTNNQ